MAMRALAFPTDVESSSGRGERRNEPLFSFLGGRQHRAC